MEVMIPWATGARMVMGVVAVTMYAVMAVPLLMRDGAAVMGLGSGAMREVGRSETVTAVLCIASASRAAPQPGVSRGTPPGERGRRREAGSDDQPQRR